MKIVGMMPSAPGEALTQIKTETVEVPAGGDKVTEVVSPKAQTEHNSNLNTEVKQGIGRLFERLKLMKAQPPPPPFSPGEKSEKRKNAIRKYKNIGKTPAPNGQKLNTAA